MSPVINLHVSNKLLMKVMNDVRSGALYKTPVVLIINDRG